MEITAELPDEEVESAIETWADSNLDSYIESYLENNDVPNEIIESCTRTLLDNYAAAGGACETAKAFEAAVNKVLEKGDYVRTHIKPSRDVLQDMVVTELARTFYDMETILKNKENAARNAELQ